MNELYRKIENLYQELIPYEDLPPNEFSEKAASALRKLSFDSPVKDTEIIDIALNLNPLPRQYYQELEFGEFNLTLFFTDHFSIQLYIMNQIDTEIHDHGFVGAYKVLSGQNIQSCFEFNPEKNIDNTIALGNLKKISSQKYKLNDVFELKKDTIHQITRLDDKNITLMVMKNVVSQNYFYLSSGIRIDNLRSRSEYKRSFFAIYYLYKKSQIFCERCHSFLNSLSLKEKILTYNRIQNFPFETNFLIQVKKSIYSLLEAEGYAQYLAQHDDYLKKQNLLSQMK